MKTIVLLPDNFTDYLLIDNAEQRFSEARMVAEKIQAAGVPLMRNLAHRYFLRPSSTGQRAVESNRLCQRVGYALLSFAGRRMRLH